MCASNCSDTISRRGEIVRQVGPNLRPTVRGLAGLWLNLAMDRLREWAQRRRYRSYLATMDERGLRDIAVARTDAEGEANRPFWSSPVLDEATRGREGRARKAACGSA